MADGKKTLELQIEILAQQAIAQVNSLSADIKSLSQEAKAFSTHGAGVSNAFKHYQEEAARAANSMKLFGVSTDEVKRQQETAKRAALDLVEAGFKPESKEVQNLVAQYRQLEGQAKEIDKANAGNISSFGELKSAVTQTAAAVALIKTVDKIKDIAGFALAQADAFQNARNEFGILLGDMEAGAGLFNQIKAFNDKTPFDLSTLTQATNVLIAAKVPLAELESQLTKFGDLAQGDSQRLASYIHAFSQASAKGKADMQVLNTYLNQGVPILGALAKQFKVTEAAVLEMSSNGQISFEAFNAALDSLTAEGGQYFGGMELRSKSLGAMQEGLKESVNSLAASFGDMLLPAMTKVIGMITGLTDAINGSPLLKGLLAAAVVAVTGYLAAMAVKQALLAVKTWLAYAAQMGFNSALAVTNPLLLAGIAAAAAATVAIVAYASAQQRAASNAEAAALAAAQQAGGYDAAAEAARQYARALDDLGLAGQRAFLGTTQAAAAALAQEKARLEQALKATPEDEIIESSAGSGIFMTVENESRKRLQEALAKVNEELEASEARVSAVISRMGELREAAIAAFGSEWRDKLKSGIAAINDEEAKAAAALTARAESLFKEAYETNAEYQAEMEALHEYFRRKRAGDKKEIESLGTAWQDKMLSGIAALEREWKQAQDELAKNASKIYGKEFEEQKAYKDELGALDDYYGKRRGELERSETLQAHKLRMDKIKEEWEYQRELARQNGDYLKFAGYEFMSSIEQTDVGQLISVMQSGGNPWMMLLSIIIKAISQLESFGEALNFLSNFIKDAFGKVDHLARNAMANLYSALDDLADVIADILPLFLHMAKSINDSLAFALKTIMPVLKLIGEAFAWLYNHVLVPFGNAVVGFMNAIISLINKIPGVNIQKLAYFEVIGDMAEDMAKEMERHKEEIAKMYNRQMDRVRDELAAQISSIRQQYELGLISRGEYERQAEAYQASAESKLLDINEKMLKELEKIDANTYGALSPDQKAYVDDAANEAFELNSLAGVAQIAGGLMDPATAGVVSAVVDASNGNWLDAGLNLASGGLWGGVKKIFGFDSGTPFVPRDMAALIHQGEGIIPRTFNAGIQAGDYALVGRTWPDATATETSGKAGVTVNVSVNVEGSVVTERDIVEAVYEGIASGIHSGGLEPLPA